MLNISAKGIGVLLLLLFPSTLLAADPIPLPESLPISSPKPEELTPWTLIKQKSYPNYKVEIFQRSTKGKFPRVESTKAHITPNGGGAAVDYKGTWLNPDPKTFVMGWQGGLLDVDGDGLEDLVLQNYSAGVHCCYNYVIYSLAKPLKKLSNISMKDCGAQIRLEDLNGDKKPEIISCNPDFVYLGKIPYSDSPFPPAIYVFRDGTYKRADKEFKQIFLSDIQTQRDALAKGYDPSNALQIVADYLILGEDVQAWKEFDSLYQGEDKEAMRTELMKRTGKLPESQASPAESKPTLPPQKSPAAANPAKTDAW